MRKLFTEIFLLIFLFALMIWLLEKRYSAYMTKADEMMKNFRMASDHAEVLLAGNSHMIAVYDEMRKEGDTNVAFLGMEGIDLFQLRNLSCRYASQMKKLKFILINADEYAMGNNLKISNFLYTDRMLYPYTGTLYDETFSSALAAKSHFLRSNRDLSFLFCGQDLQSTKAAEIRNAYRLMTEASCADRAGELSEKRFQENLYGENSRFCDDMLDCLKMLHVPCVVVTLPKSPCYHTYENTAHASQGISILRELSADHAIPYYDLSHEPSFTNDHFRDADHLNESGVRLLEHVMDSLLAADHIVSDFGRMIERSPPTSHGR